MDMKDKAEEIVEFLFGGWEIEELENLVGKNFPDYTKDQVSNISQRLAYLHFSGKGYEIEDMEAILVNLESLKDDELLYN